MSTSGFGSLASSSPLKCASMWKNAARAIVPERFSQAWSVPRCTTPATLLVEYLQVGTLESRFLFTEGKV